MMHSLKSFTWAPLALLLLGCKNEVTDTEGRTFTFDCKSAICTLSEKPDDSKQTSVSKQPKDDGKLTFTTNTEGRVLLVCPAEKPGFECRPLACDPSTPCSRLGGSDFTCQKSLCQAPGRPLSPSDRLALCLAKTGPWQRTPAQLERLTLARACTGDCVLPASCLKP